ncbi:putative interleukin-17 receptor E-like [Sarcophilus harrisii]|uniref:Interleukin 17 receptor E like n=1 Tax=Sarcophilus harrisii TaxID=9305 RepID=A0A7N4P5W5_SARHA|nr:putative interleukin-17 receptor E-like [Sarcophilus harrisii]
MLSGNAIIFLTLVWGTREGQTILQIAECGFACSEGVSCKNKVNRNIFNSFCRQPPFSMAPPTLESLMLSTVMKCAHRESCALHLSVGASLVMEGSLRGLEICLLSLDTQETRCHSIRIPKVSSQKMVGKTLQVHFDCFEVSVAQHLYVTVKTIPYYCKVQISREYHVEDCTDADVARNIAACFAGRLQYNVDHVQKAIEVHFADIPRGQPYYVRLCLKWFACEDYSPPVLVNAEQPGKPVSLKYSQLLPCLCIEGWAAVPDAVRIQICPFENDTRILWDYIFYNPFTQSLSWEPPCPVQGEVHLCGMSELGHQCWELSHTGRTVPGNVHYLQVDPQPWLCMKFTTLQGSWVKCPFADRKFPGWKMKIHQLPDKLRAFFISKTPARFQVRLCNRSNPSHCHVLKTISVTPQGGADATGHIDIPESEVCSPDICIQGWRTDVDYSIPVQMCDIRCNNSSKKKHRGLPNSPLSIHKWEGRVLASP